jgi:adenosylcobinamide-phosphate synthase
MLTLPLVCPPWTQWVQRVQAAERDGSADPSPNAGRSEAIYAHCIGIQLGGENRYGERLVQKPLLGAGQACPNVTLVKSVLKASSRLEIVWLSGLVIIQWAISR